MNGVQAVSRAGKRGKVPDPRCAFVGECVYTDNWNCATMNRLRGYDRRIGR